MGREALCGKEGDGDGSTRRKRGSPKRRWLDKVRDDNQREGIIRGGSVRPSYMEAYVMIQVHRPDMKVGIR